MTCSTLFKRISFISFCITILSHSWGRYDLYYSPINTEITKIQALILFAAFGFILKINYILNLKYV